MDPVLGGREGPEGQEAHRTSPDGRPPPPPDLADALHPPLEPPAQRPALAPVVPGFASAGTSTVAQLPRALDRVRQDGVDLHRASPTTVGRAGRDGWRGRRDGVGGGSTDHHVGRHLEARLGGSQEGARLERGRPLGVYQPRSRVPDAPAERAARGRPVSFAQDVVGGQGVDVVGARPEVARRSAVPDTRGSRGGRPGRGTRARRRAQGARRDFQGGVGRSTGQGAGQGGRGVGSVARAVDG